MTKWNSTKLSKLRIGNEAETNKDENLNDKAKINI